MTTESKKMERTAVLESLHALVKCVGDHRDECAILYLDRDTEKLLQIGTKHGQDFFTARPAYSTDFLTFCSQRLMSTVEGAVEVGVVNADFKEYSKEDTCTDVDVESTMQRASSILRMITKSRPSVDTTECDATVTSRSPIDTDCTVVTRRKSGRCQPKRHFPEYDTSHSTYKRRKKEAINKIQNTKDRVKEEENSVTKNCTKEKVCAPNVKEEIADRCEESKTTQKGIVDDNKENLKMVDDDDNEDDVFDDNNDDVDDQGSSKKNLQESEEKSVNAVKAEVETKVEPVELEPICLQCNRRFHSMNGLNMHLKQSGHKQECTSETDFLCYSCFRYYQREWDLLRHMKDSGHTGNDEIFINRKLIPVIPKRDDTEAKKRNVFRCTCCKATYRGQDRGENHIKQGACVPKVSKRCPCCDAVFHDKNSQQVHIKKYHKNEYPFVCKDCGNQFYERRHLNSHAKSHMVHKSVDSGDSVRVKNDTHIVQGEETNTCINGKNISHSDMSEKLGKDDVYGAVEDNQKKWWTSDAGKTLIGQVKSGEETVGEALYGQEKLGTDNDLDINSREAKQTLQSTSGRGKMDGFVMQLQRQIRDMTDSQAIIRDDLDSQQVCVVCSEQFVNYTQLKIHIVASGHQQVEEEATGYKCFTCSKYFTRFVDLEYHMELTCHTGNQETNKERKVEKVCAKGVQKEVKNFKCSVCLTAFNTIEKCEKHISKASCESKKRRKCTCCDMYFQKENLLQAHMYQYHSYDYPFKCDFCTAEFTLIAPFIVHRTSHLPGPDKTWSREQMECQICGRIFTEKHLLDRHVKNSHLAADMSIAGTEPEVINTTGSLTDFTYFKCFSCDLYFVNCQSLTLHMKETLHTGLPEQEKEISMTWTIMSNVTDKSILKPYRCTRCHTAFGMQKNAEEHVAKATCKPYYKKTCPCCPEVFWTKNLYEAHLLDQHKDEYPFKCKDCGQIFYQLSGLMTHAKVHGNELEDVRPKGLNSYPCPICQKLLSRKSDIRHHINNVHKGKNKSNPIVCDICGKSYASAKVLKTHIQNVHKETGSSRVSCPECGKVMKNKLCLYSHMTLIHKRRGEVVCELCGYKAKSKAMLDYHRASKHTMGDRFRCEECGAGFKIKPHYGIHMAQHYIDRGDLQQAKKLAAIYECEICHKHMPNKTRCEQHMLNHLGDRAKLECKLCGLKVMNAVRGLKTHYKKKHKLCKADIDELTKDEIPVKVLLAQLKEEMLNKEIPIPELEEKSPSKKRKFMEKRRKDQDVEEDGTFENIMDVNLSKEDSNIDYLEEEEGEEYIVTTSAPYMVPKTTVVHRDFDAEANNQISLLIQSAAHGVGHGTEMIVIEEVPPGSTL